MSNIISGKRTLLIESNMEHAERMQPLLRSVGVTLFTASTIQKAISQMMIHTFDAVALNINVKESSRLIGLLLDLRHAKSTLLLLFPIENSEIRISFFNQGFDMCLPYSDPKECAAVICALLRRPSAHEYPAEATPPGRILYKDLTIDPLRRKVLIKDTEVVLTPLEFNLLYFLASNPSIVFSREVIYERVWRENSLYGTKSVTDLICSIRSKMGLPSKDREYIKTINGIGYCFAP